MEENIIYLIGELLIMEMQEVKDFRYPQAADSNSLIITLQNDKKLVLTIKPL